MARAPKYPLFQNWLLNQMVDFELTSMSLAMKLDLLDGDIEDWVAGRKVPDPSQCSQLAELLDMPVHKVLEVAGW